MVSYIFNLNGECMKLLNQLTRYEIEQNLLRYFENHTVQAAGYNQEGDSYTDIEVWLSDATIDLTEIINIVLDGIDVNPLINQKG